LAVEKYKTMDVWKSNIQIALNVVEVILKKRDGWEIEEYLLATLKPSFNFSQVDAELS
jgi:hypothetical protein